LTMRSGGRRLGLMKSAKSKEPETSEEYQRFEKYAKALMAVPKKELDKELAKDERKKQTKTSKRRN
jgi:hypothetical protein